MRCGYLLASQALAGHTQSLSGHPYVGDRYGFTTRCWSALRCRNEYVSACGFGYQSLVKNARGVSTGRPRIGKHQKVRITRD